MLAKAQNATAMLSLEFGELARALPETIASAEDSGPSDVEAVTYEIDDRIRRINDLFKKTGELSEEIAETLQSSKEAADGAATRFAGDSRPGTVPWSEQQPQAAPAAEAAVSETSTETTTSTPDPAPSQPPLSVQPPANEPEEEVVGRGRPGCRCGG